MSVRWSGASRHLANLLPSLGCGQKKGGSISRVLSRVTISLGAAVTRALVRPTRRIPGRHIRGEPRRRPGERAALLLLGLAPNEVYHASSVTGRAVGSYPAFSPLVTVLPDSTEYRGRAGAA